MHVILYPIQRNLDIHTLGVGDTLEENVREWGMERECLSHTNDGNQGNCLVYTIITNQTIIPHVNINVMTRLHHYTHT